jgi:hypothetical protein
MSLRFFWGAVLSAELQVKVHEHLLQTSRSTLDAINKAAFVVCLDSGKPFEQGGLHDFSRNLWHGDGRNRWFDKPVQIIVGDDGRLGINGEHSCMDGRSFVIGGQCCGSLREKSKRYTDGESLRLGDQGSPRESSAGLPIAKRRRRFTSTRRIPPLAGGRRTAGRDRQG